MDACISYQRPTQVERRPGRSRGAFRVISLGMDSYPDRKPLSRRSGTTDIHPGDVRLLTSAHRSVQDRV